MIITEQIERNCCAPQDLESYKGKRSNRFPNQKPKFCIHCGQIWYEVTETTPAGSRDSFLEKWKLDL